MTKTLLLLLFLVFPHIVFSQTNTFVDTRDNSTYTIVTINGKKWLSENLKLQTPNSFYPKYANKLPTKGNYYYATETKNICPLGWRIANSKDWAHFFKFLLEEAQNTDPNIRVDTFWRHKKKNHGVQYDLTNVDYSLFAKHDTLQILNTHLNNPS